MLMSTNLLAYFSSITLVPGFREFFKTWNCVGQRRVINTGQVINSSVSCHLRRTLLAPRKDVSHPWLGTTGQDTPHKSLKQNRPFATVFHAQVRSQYIKTQQKKSRKPPLLRHRSGIHAIFGPYTTQLESNRGPCKMCPRAALWIPLLSNMSRTQYWLLRLSSSASNKPVNRKNML